MFWGLGHAWGVLSQFGPSLYWQGFASIPATATYMAQYQAHAIYKRWTGSVMSVVPFWLCSQGWGMPVVWCRNLDGRRHFIGKAFPINRQRPPKWLNKEPRQYIRDGKILLIAGVGDTHCFGRVMWVVSCIICPALQDSRN